MNAVSITKKRIINVRTDRCIQITLLALLYISALPDAMVVPVLRGLVVDRYGVSIGAAHAFMAVNLLGALLAVGALNRLRQLASTRTIIAGAAAMNALLLGVMALPIGFKLTILLRCLEGGADLIVYALLFDLIAQTGNKKCRGRRMGASATFLMLGIASGIGIGGIVGGIQPIYSLLAGSMACGLAGLVAILILPQYFNKKFQTAPATSALQINDKPLWQALTMMFTDRGLAALLATTVPLYLASVVDWSAPVIGGMIGVSMLLTAIGTWPAGLLADRIGYLQVRVIGAALFPVGLALVATTVSMGMAWTLITMIFVGIGGALLFASSLIAVCQSDRGPEGMAAYHAAGNIGFLIAPFVAGLLLSSLGGKEPSGANYSTVLTTFAILHVVSSVVVFASLVVKKRRPTGDLMSPAATDVSTG